MNFQDVISHVAAVGTDSALELKERRKDLNLKDRENLKTVSNSASIDFMNIIKSMRGNTTIPELRALQNNKDVSKFLDRYIGSVQKDRDAVTKQFLKVLTGTHESKNVAKTLSESIQNKYFLELELKKHRQPIVNAIGEDFIEFLPKKMVIDLDPTGEIREITEKYGKIGETIDVKQQRLADLIGSINDIKRQVASDLNGTFGTDRHVCALLVAIMLETGIRPGDEDNGVWIDPKSGEVLLGPAAQSKVPEKVWLKTYGATDLKVEHIKDQGSSMHLQFVGKMGSTNKAVVKSRMAVNALREYISKAMGEGEDYVLRNNSGNRMNDGVLAKYCEQHNFRPTDLRKLKSNESFYENLKVERAKLLKEIKSFMDTDDVKSQVIAAVKRAVTAAMEKSRSDLSHDKVTTTIENYISPMVLINFLSTGKVLDSLSAMVASAGTILKFDPKTFLEAAMEDA